MQAEEYSEKRCQASVICRRVQDVKMVKVNWARDFQGSLKF